MKTVYGCLCAFMLGAACYADAHNNPSGALIALCISVIWFIAYCAALRTMLDYKSNLA